MKRPPFLRSRAAVAGAVGAALLAGVTTVIAQAPPMQAIQWDARRLDQLDRNVRRLERAVTQRNAAGQPVLVEPDPEVVALQGRVGIMDRRLQDLEATVQRVNGDLERLTFQLDESQRSNDTLNTRLRAMETQVQRLETAAAAAEAARAAAPPEPARPSGTAASAFAAARALIGAEAVAAYEDVIAGWPDTPQAQEAEWRIGDIRRAGGDQAAAVSAYARALRGWPTQAWAGEVTLKLARGLAATNRKPAACQALVEFDQRYRAAASTELRGIAQTVRGQAGCS